MRVSFFDFFFFPSRGGFNNFLDFSSLLALRFPKDSHSHLHTTLPSFNVLSHTHTTVYDTNSGLIGPIVIQSRDASTTIAAERFLLFNVFDEVKSNYLKHNLITNVRSLPGPLGTRVTLPAANISLPLPEGLFRLYKYNDLFRKYSKKLCTLMH